MSKISPAKRDWTVLIYQGNGCFGKSETHRSDLLELQKLPPSDRVTFVSQSHEDYKNNVLWRREIASLPESVEVVGPVKRVEGRQNQPEQLADFVKWGLKEYPSERTCLVISGYAGGPTGILGDEKDGLTPLNQIRKGLKEGLDGKELDVLAFDGNWMACIEAATEFVGTADLMVASQGRMDSWNYEERFRGLVDDPESDTDTLASQLVVADKEESGMTAYWLEEVPNALSWLDMLLEEASRRRTRRVALKRAQDVSHFKDLLSAVKAFTGGRRQDELWEIATEAEDALKDVALMHGGLSGIESSGINVATSYGDSKEGKAFRVATGWDQFLEWSKVH